MDLQYIFVQNLMVTASFTMAGYVYTVGFLIIHSNIVQCWYASGPPISLEKLTANITVSNIELLEVIGIKSSFLKSRF